MITNSCENMITNSCENDVDISFCFPVYNVERYLKRCVDSITKQIERLRVEFVFVDDCSKDDSFATLTEIQKHVPNTIVHRNEENKGVSYTRNRLIELARGKYIWFIDPDDLLYPDCVNYFWRDAQSTEADLILGNFVKFQESDIAPVVPKNQKFLFETCQPIGSSILPRDEVNNPMSAVWAGLIKKEVLMEYDLRFQEGMIAQEDTLFYYELLLRVEKCRKTQSACYLYMQRSNSAMHSRSEKRAVEYYKAMRIMYNVYNRYVIAPPINCKTFNTRILKSKLHHTRENIAYCLLNITDTQYVTNELRLLRQEKIYPYPFRYEILRAKMPWPIKIGIFLLPIRPMFWLLHFICKPARKRQYGNC